MIIDNAFFLLSKIVWTLIRPETVLLFLLLLALILQRRSGRLARGLLATAAAAIACISLLPVGDILLAPLERQFPANPPVREVSNIVVLGGGENTDLSRAWDQPQTNEAGERFLAAITLARRFPDARLVFTGGSGALLSGARAEAHVAEAIFLEAGIDRHRLKIEGAARNTAENAEQALKLIERGNSGAILLITSAWHMPRAAATFCSEGWRNLLPWPVDFRSGAFSERIRWDLAAHLDDLNVGAKEWLGFLADRLSGRISPAGEVECMFDGEAFDGFSAAALSD